MIESTNIQDHEDAGHTLILLPYDPDYGDNQWKCLECQITVVVPGWK